MNIDPTQLKLVSEFKHETPLLSCAVDAQGRFLIAGGRDRKLLAIDLASSQMHPLVGHDSWVGVMTRIGDGVLTGDYAGRVIAWDVHDKIPQPRWTIEAHPCSIYGLSASADGKTFATGDRDGRVRIWQTVDGKQLRELPRIEFPVYGVALHPDGERIVTADRQPQKPRVKVWHLASGQEQRSIDVAELSGYRRVEDIEWGGIRALAVSSDGNQLVACGRNGYDGQACAMIYEANSGKLQHKLALELKGGFYYSAQFHPQGFLMTAGGDLAKGEIRCWDPSTGKSLANLATSGPSFALDIHPQGTRVAVAQAIGKRSAPESGLLAIFEWST